MKRKYSLSKVDRIDKLGRSSKLQRKLILTSSLSVWSHTTTHHPNLILISPIQIWGLRIVLYACVDEFVIATAGLTLCEKSLMMDLDHYKSLDVLLFKWYLHNMVCTMEEPPVRPWSQNVGEDGLRNYINKPEGGRAASFLKMTNIKNRPITIIISTTIGGNINIFVIPPSLLS